jgi:transposase-like protein
MASAHEPRTLQEAILFFADYENCYKAVVDIRWPDGIVRCPTCGSSHISYLANQRRWKCYEKHPRQQFSLKVGTIFEDSPLPLQKWLPALWLLVNCKNGISSYELGRALGVTQKTAWFMLSGSGSPCRVKVAASSAERLKPMKPTSAASRGTCTRASGSAWRQARSQHCRQVAVMGLLARHGSEGKSRVRTEVLSSPEEGHVQGTFAHTSKLAPTSTPMRSSRIPDLNPTTCITSSTTPSATSMAPSTPTAGELLESLKRAIKGTYVSIEPFHLFRYLDEQSFRFNERGLNDAQRFVLGLKGIINKRLTYVALTGSELPQTC